MICIYLSSLSVNPSDSSHLRCLYTSSICSSFLYPFLISGFTHLQQMLCIYSTLTKKCDWWRSSQVSRLTRRVSWRRCLPSRPGCPAVGGAPRSPWSLHSASIMYAVTKAGIRDLEIGSSVNVLRRGGGVRYHHYLHGKASGGVSLHGHRTDIFQIDA